MESKRSWGKQGIRKVERQLPPDPVAQGSYTLENANPQQTEDARKGVFCFFCGRLDIDREKRILRVSQVEMTGIYQFFRTLREGLVVSFGTLRTPV